MRSRVDCPGRCCYGRKGGRGRALYCGGAGTEPFDYFFVPVTRVGYKVDLASLFGHIDIIHSSVVSSTICLPSSILPILVYHLNNNSKRVRHPPDHRWNYA